MTKTQKFSSGRIVTTLKISADMAASPDFAEFVDRCLSGHFSGYWGNISESEAELNDKSISKKQRIDSVYNVPETVTTGEDEIWIITKADRSATTILYPSEY